jgi:hypothetical protein
VPKTNTTSARKIYKLADSSRAAERMRGGGGGERCCGHYYSVLSMFAFLFPKNYIALILLNFFENI